MTSTSSVLLVIALVFAILNWIAVSRQHSLLEYISKPSATVAFLLMAASLDVVHDASWKWRLAAFAFCIAGDVFLMLPKDAFIPGLASFAVAQVLFTVSFVTGGVSGSRIVIGIVIAALGSGLLARRFVSAIKSSGHKEFVMPVIVYMGVISAMLVGAIGSGSGIAIVAAVIFMASDSLIAETRFVKAQPWHSVGIMVTYHAALAGLVFALL